MPKYFYPTTRETMDQITSIFDFVWPNAVALWNLRWQVSGYVEARRENLTETELFNRFASGSNIHGANLKRAMINTSWEDQQEMFAQILLTNAFAIYEGWLEDLATTLALTDAQKTAMQFSQRPPKKCLLDVINQFHASLSSDDIVISRFTYNSLQRNNKYSLSILNELMCCYRYFKECRNAFIHHHGKATDRVITAYKNFNDTHQALLDFGMKEIPEHNAISTEGDQVILSLRGVVGFFDIIQRIIITIDAELSNSSFAKTIFFKQLEKLSSSCTRGHGTPSLQQKRLGRKMTGLNIPFDPTVLPDVWDLLQRNHIAI